jgi:hypothetical protein
MIEQTEVVEGQGLSRAILQALDQDMTPDWAALDRAYGERLLELAKIRLRHLDLHRDYTPDDALHGFLKKRVYPPDKARKMFAPTAGGERPLGPRLLASLGNYCNDLTRSRTRRRERGDRDDVLASTPARSADPLPAYEDVECLLHRQLAAIRVACPPRRRPRGAPYREALLLRLRLDWAGGFDEVELRSELTGRPVMLDLPLLERLTAWTDDERAMLLVEEGTSLEQLWQGVRTILLRSADRDVSVERLAPLIPASRDLWNQWISRGRRMLQAKLGADYAPVFAVWGDRGEGA